MSYSSSPTLRMVSYAQSLLSTKEHQYGEAVPAEMSFDAVSNLISALKYAPSKGSASTDLPEPGIYKLDDGTLVKVKFNQSHTNRYSLRGININSVRLNENDEIVNFDYVYAPELRAQCNEENQVTVEEAQSWGIKYGNCLACGRTLKHAKSVKAGIGPVCIKQFRI